MMPVTIARSATVAPLRARPRAVHRLPAIALVAIAIAGCGGSPEPTPPDATTGSGSAAVTSYPSGCTSSTVNGVALTTCDIAPSSTGSGISALSPASGDFHHVVVPTSTDARNHKLLVFLGGSRASRARTKRSRPRRRRRDTASSTCAIRTA